MATEAEMAALMTMAHGADTLASAADYLLSLITKIGVEGGGYYDRWGQWVGGGSSRGGVTFTQETYQTNLNAIAEWRLLAARLREARGRLDLEVAARERAVASRVGGAPPALSPPLPPPPPPAPPQDPPQGLPLTRFELIELE